MEKTKYLIHIDAASFECLVEDITEARRLADEFSIDQGLCERLVKLEKDALGLRRTSPVFRQVAAKQTTTMQEAITTEANRRKHANH
jgi:hypothetical protein